MRECWRGPLQKGGFVVRFDRRRLCVRGPRRRQADLSLAKQVPGWSPTMELEQGLERLSIYRYFPDLN